jgi:uncharacterized protein YraI
MRITRFVLLFVLVAWGGIVSPVPASAQACSGFDTQLSVGTEAQITPGAANSLRAQPSTSSERIGTIPGRARLSIIGGPRCGDGFTFWQVNYNDTIGWTAEGADDDYYMIPYDGPDDTEETVVNTRPNNILTGLGLLGGGGGDATRIERTLGNAAYGGMVSLDFVPSGERITAPIKPNVLLNELLFTHPFLAMHTCMTPSDTNCVREKPDVQAISPDGVVYAGDEFFGLRYTRANPFICNGSRASQIFPVVDGVRVMDGLGVLNLRPSPDNDPVLERIPAGAVAELIDGPECGSGSNVWWNVSYNGITGWVAENSSTQQWLEAVQEYRGYWLPPQAYLQAGVWQLRYADYVLEVVIPNINAPYAILNNELYAISGFEPFENLLAMNPQTVTTFTADANGQALIPAPPDDFYIVIVGQTGNYVHDELTAFKNATTGLAIAPEDIVNSILVQMNR